MPKLILETARLVLREMSLDDLDFVATMLANSEVMRYYPKCYTRDEAAGWVQRQMDRYARHGHGLWLVSEKATGQAVGQVGLLVQNVRGVDEREVGYLIHWPFWRRGFATEAAAACRDYALTVFGNNRVISLIRPENLPSQGVARKIGMRPETGLVQHGGFEHIVFSLKPPLTRSPCPTHRFGLSFFSSWGTIWLSVLLRVTGEAIIAGISKDRRPPIVYAHKLNHYVRPQSRWDAAGRLLELHPDFDTIALAIDDLVAAGMLHGVCDNGDPVRPRLQPEAYRYRFSLRQSIGMVQFSHRWREPEHRLWRAAVIGDWLLAHELGADKRGQADYRFNPPAGRQ